MRWGDGAQWSISVPRVCNHLFSIENTFWYNTQNDKYINEAIKNGVAVNVSNVHLSSYISHKIHTKIKRKNNSKYIDTSDIYEIKINKYISDHYY